MQSTRKCGCDTSQRGCSSCTPDSVIWRLHTPGFAVCLKFSVTRQHWCSRLSIARRRQGQIVRTPSGGPAGGGRHRLKLTQKGLRVSSMLKLCEELLGGGLLYPNRNLVRHADERLLPHGPTAERLEIQHPQSLRL